MTDYEIQIDGPIGPVARSCLTGFTAVALPSTVLLRGTVAGTDELLGVMSLLTAHGVAPIDIRINRAGSR